MEEFKEELNKSLDEEFQTFCDEHTYKYVYKCSWYESKRHKKSHIDMFYENPDDVKWIFDTPEWHNDLVKIEYIRVCSHSNQYISASLNSITYNQNGNKEATKRIIKEFIR